MTRDSYPTRVLGGVSGIGMPSIDHPTPTGRIDTPTNPMEPLVRDAEPAESRTKTRETRSTIVVDLECGTTEAVAAFLEFIALAVRERRQLRITVE